MHTDIGDKCQHPRVDGAMASLSTKIRSGDVVEIITSEKQTPKMNWLTFARTPKARQKIMGKLNIQRARETGQKKIVAGGNRVKTSNNKVRLAKCCAPLPGDRIIGFRTTKRKISVHRAGCRDAAKLAEKKVEVEWEEKANYYDTEIIVEAKDRLGILKDILEVFSSNKIYVGYANARASESSTATCTFTVKLKSIGQLEEIMRKLRNVKGVFDAYRAQ